MKKILRSPAVTGFLFLMALILLVFGSIGGTRAALNRESAVYESQMNTTSMAIAIRQGSETIEPNKLMKISSGDMVSLAGDKSFKIGKNYSLPLSVYNSGSVDESVRVTIYKYWVTPSGSTETTGWFDGSGTKDQNLDPDLIVIRPASGWTEDTDPNTKTKERSVYYYSGTVAPGGSVQFLESVALNGQVAKEIKEVNGKYVYTYDGLGFVLEIQADAVQTHNGSAAKISSWGQNK